MRARVTGLFVYPIEGFQGVASRSAQWNMEFGFLSQHQFQLRTEWGSPVSPQNCPRLQDLQVKFLLSQGLIEVGVDSESREIFELTAGNVALEKTFSSVVGERVRLLPIEKAAGSGPSLVSVESLRAFASVCREFSQAKGVAISQPEILVDFDSDVPFYEDRWCADRRTLGVGGLLLAARFSKRLGCAGMPFLMGGSWDSRLMGSLERLRQERENPPFGEVRKGSNFLGITTSVLNSEDCPLVALGDTVSSVRRCFRAYSPSSVSFRKTRELVPEAMVEVV